MKLGQSLAKLCSVMLAVMVLSACSGSNPGTSGSSGGKEGEDGERAEKHFKYSTMVSTFAEVPDMNNQFWTRFQEENNLDMDVQWIPDPEFQTKLNLAVASGELPDVVSAQNPHDINTMNAVEDGVYWDLGLFLGDMSDYPNLKNHIPEIAWQLSQIKGTHYYIPRARSQINTGFFIREDLLQEVDLPVPQTVDELHEALKAIKAESANASMIGTLFHDNMAFAFGKSTPQYNSEGGLIRDVLADSYTNMVEWYRQLYADGLMTPEFAIIKGAEVDNFFLSGKTIFVTKNMWHQYRFEQEVKKLKPDAKVAIIPAMKGPGGSAPYLEPGYTGGLFIPKQVPEERVRQILDVFERAASEENSKALFYGYAGVHHNEENGKYVMTDIGKKEIQSFTNDPFSIKRNEWDKVDSPLAPVEVDLANREIAKAAYDELTVDPFRALVSPKWTSEWAKYVDEFESTRTKAIMGEITMEDYRAYIENLKNLPVMKEAFLELAESYKELFG